MSATPFDDLAADYDLTFTQTALGVALRGIVWQKLETSFRAGQRVLELGCGTGEDAVRLAHMGLEVIATDPSEQMLRIAREKARLQGCARRIEFHRARMEDVPELLRGARFAGVFSNFGAINCVDDIPKLATGVAALCVPRATLLLVAMGRHVPWEWVWYGVRGNRSKALRRFAQRGVGWRGLTLTYPTPRQLTALLRPHFDCVGVAPLGCILPPSYASNWLERWPMTFRVLSALERAVHRWSSLAGIADHYILHARRIETDERASH